MPTAAAIVLAADMDADEAIRRIWGDNISEQMLILGFTNKSLADALSKLGVKVSVQAVGQWRSGQAAPRPHVMVAIATVLRVPPRMMFSLDVIRAAA